MPVDRPFVDRIRGIGARQPEAPAIREGGRGITYRRLLADVDVAAGLLRAAGVRRGDAVALHARRDARLPVALLAAWEVGATVALLDATLPAARLQRCEDVVRAGWRIELAAPLAVGPCGPGERYAASHILFTSGTTGRPAAVTVTGDALTGPMRWYVSTFRPTASDRVGLLAGLGHDPLLRDLLVPLGTGGTLVVPPDGMFADPARVAGFVRESGITILHCTPALLEVILAGTAGRELSGLRLVVSAGAPMTAGIVRHLRTVSRAVCVNAYGSTETPQIASCSVLRAGAVPDPALPDGAVLGVGRGVAGAELLVDGRRGEVVVRSPHLATGYLAGTGPAERFVADPLGQPGYRAYRTGDVGELAPHGDGVRIIGRTDRQIAVNGLRIAPEEIEDAARLHPAVRRAHAGTFRGPAGDLVGLSVVLTAGGATDARSLRAFLRSQLPANAVPSRIRIVAEFELDRNHKAAAPVWT